MSEDKIKELEDRITGLENSSKLWGTLIHQLVVRVDRFEEEIKKIK